MVEDPLYTVICVDFGMTGSAAQWRNNRKQREWTMCLRGKKVVTRLAVHSESQSVVNWGGNVGVYDSNIRECFKSLVDAKEVRATQATGMTSRQEVLALVRGYLSKFCGQVVKEINQLIGGPTPMNWRNSKVVWRFTVPGCWTEDIVKDFVGEAKAGAKEWFTPSQYPNLEIIANVKEGQASAMSAILNGLSTHGRKFVAGETILTCDIGGATTDVAVNWLNNQEIPEPIHHRVPEATGMMIVDNQFCKHAIQKLGLAGYELVHSVALALWMVRSEDFAFAKCNAHITSDSWFKIELPHIWTQGQRSGDCGPESSTASFVVGDFFHIHRSTIEGFFKDFATELYHAIDAAIDAQRKNRCKIDVIALCGGGSRSKLIIELLRDRYQTNETAVLDQTDLDIQPELMTLKGSAFMWDFEEMQKDLDTTQVGVKDEKGRVQWKKACCTWIGTSQNVEKHKSPVLWSANFLIEVGQRKGFTAHKVLAIAMPTPSSTTATKALPKKFKDACQFPGVQQWDLRLQTIAASLPPKKCELVCTVVRPGICEFSITSADARSVQLESCNQKERRGGESLDL